MKKVFIFIVLVLFLISFILAVQDNETQAINDTTDSEENVCCKIYGLGSMMEQVNVYYEVINRSECSVAEDFVGGGREIVHGKYCENQTQEKNRLRIRNQTCPANCTCVGSTIKCEIEGGRHMIVMAGKSGNMIVQVKKVNMSTNVTLYRHEGKVYGKFKNNQTKTINFLPDQVQEKIREKIKTRLQNQTIELDEDGIYQIQGKKKARLFFLIPVRERVRMQIDSETGEVIKIRNPWWGFLAKDIVEEEENEEE